MSAASCTRCDAPLPTDLPHEGTRYGVQLRRRVTTTAHSLRFSRWRFRWLPEDPRDQVQWFYTDLDLCDTCAGAVFRFAQSEDPS